jgi:hypothetical protein
MEETMKPVLFDPKAACRVWATAAYTDDSSDMQLSYRWVFTNTGSNTRTIVKVQEMGDLCVQISIVATTSVPEEPLMSFSWHCICFGRADDVDRWVDFELYKLPNVGQQGRRLRVFSDGVFHGQAT